MEPLGSEAERYLRQAVAGHPIWVRSELEEELRGHLIDAIERSIQHGMERETAEREALTALGPVSELRHGLARTPRQGRLRGGVLGALTAVCVYIPIDLVALFKVFTGRPRGSFQQDYRLGRYDDIIARGELELRTRGPRFNLHHELGMAYNAIRDYEPARQHLAAEVAWLQQHPLPGPLGGHMALATAYSNLAGFLQAMGRLDEADTAVVAGLAADDKHGMLHLQRAQRHAATGNVRGA